MTRPKLICMTAILSALVATPVLAAAVDTTRRPWPAPVGHHQPRAADIPTSASVSRNPLDQEDENVDRKISNMCRGC
jgi:hypothetical protein